MSLKAYNNGVTAKEIRCVDAGGVERVIREIRKGDVQWWRGEFDPPSIQGTWTKIEDGLYQTKAVIPSYTTPVFLNDGDDTNYVIVSFHSYENTVTCEFFGDFEGVDATPYTDGLNGAFHFSYTWNDASGTALQEYKCIINVFPRSNGKVTLCTHEFVNGRSIFVEDSEFVNEYGHSWVVQGSAAHNKMCSDAFEYYTNTTVDPWGIYGRRDNTWYNENNTYSGATNYLCSDNGRAFSVKVLSGSVSLVFCPPGGSEAGWVASEDSKFPASSGWYQKTKKDGYTKFFNTSTGRFAEYLPKESFLEDVLDMVCDSIGSNLSESEYENRVVCTCFNASHLATHSFAVEGNREGVLGASDYDFSYVFDVYNIPLVNLTTGECIFGHYNPSVEAEFTIDETSCRYTSSGILFDAVITTTFSNGNASIALEISPDAGFSPNTFLTSKYPVNNYMYTFDYGHAEYASLIIACVADSGTDVVGDFHEYRLPAGASYELRNISTVANGTTTTFTPTAGYVLGIGLFSDSDSTFNFVIRPAALSSSYYHRIVLDHPNVPSPNDKSLEISADLKYFGTDTYSTPQNSLAENKKLVPVYWTMGSAPEDRPSASYDGSRYMTSSKLTYPITLTMEWDPEGEVFTDAWWSAYYVLPIQAPTPMTVAKAAFMCDVIDIDRKLPGVEYINSSGFYSTVTNTTATFTNGVCTITQNRTTGTITMTSTAKNNLPSGFTYTYQRKSSSGEGLCKLLCYGHSGGPIELDMITGNYTFIQGES